MKPLRTAADWTQSHRYQVLGLLVAGMKDLNARNAGGLTALDLALRGENSLSAKFLIEHGAQSTLRQEKGRTLSQLLEMQVKDWENSCGRGTSRHR